MDASGATRGDQRATVNVDRDAIFHQSITPQRDCGLFSGETLGRNLDVVIHPFFGVRKDRHIGLPRQPLS
jgi:hypothetical protein